MSKRGPTYAKIIYKELSPETSNTPHKVTVVGTGAVGTAAAFSCVMTNTCTDIALVDARREAAQGEMLDMQHSLAFGGRRINITADSDYVVSKGSRVVIITAGARQAVGETRLDLVQKNVGIFKVIIPQVVKYSPECVLVIVSNPCDIMAWVAWKLSGLPKHKVISSGTCLDTSRFRYLLSEKLGVAPHSVHGYIIGEHGDSSVAVWSSVNVCGTRLKDLTPTAGEGPEKDPENWDQVHKEVIGAAYEIIKLKGFTNWGIGTMCAKIADAILKNQRSVLTVGVQPDGWNGINEEVYISIPCVIAEQGITHVVNMKLDPQEMRKLQDSARALRQIIDGIKL